MKITKRQLKQIIREEYSRLKNSGLLGETSRGDYHSGKKHAERGEPQVGEIWFRKRSRRVGSAFVNTTIHNRVEVLGYQEVNDDRPNFLSREIIITSDTHPSNEQAVVSLPLVSFLDSYEREA